MPDEEKSGFVDRMIQGLLRQALSGVRKSAERFAKRIVRLIAMALAGVAMAVLGVAFLSIGFVRILSTLVPNWLAWMWVGVVLILVGIVCFQQSRIKQ